MSEEDGGGALSTLGEAVSGGFDAFVDNTVGRLFEFLDELLAWVVNIMLVTPYPESESGFYGTPTDETWIELHSMYMGRVIPIAYSLLFFALFLYTFSNIFDGRKKIVTGRRLIFTFVFLVVWWPLGGWYLQFVNELTNWALSIGTMEQEEIAGNLLIDSTGDLVGGIIGAAVLYTVGAIPIIIVIFVYVVRWAALHVYMVAMPLLFVVWCVPWGPFSSWASKFMNMFVPISLIPIPVAFLLAVYSVLSVPGGFGAADTVVGLVLLGIAGILPKYMLGASSQISRSVRQGARGTSAAAAGAKAEATRDSGSKDPFETRSLNDYRASSGGAAGSGAGGGTASASASGSSGGGSGGGGGGRGGGRNRKAPSFDHPTASRARKQRRRAGKLGQGTAKAGKKLAGAAEKGVGAAYRSYDKEGSTAKNLAGEGKKGAAKRGKKAAKGLSKRQRKVRRNMRRRQRDLKKKYGASNSGPSAADLADGASTSSSDTAGDAGSRADLKDDLAERNQQVGEVLSEGAAAGTDEDGDQGPSSKREMGYEEFAERVESGEVDPEDLDATSDSEMDFIFDPDEVNNDGRGVGSFDRDTYRRERNMNDRSTGHVSRAGDDD